MSRSSTDFSYDIYTIDEEYITTVVTNNGLRDYFELKKPPANLLSNLSIAKFGEKVKYKKYLVARVPNRVLTEKEWKVK